MLKSKIDNVKNDFLFIEKEDHIESVFGTMESNFHKYFDSFGNDFNSQVEQLSKSYKVVTSNGGAQKYKSHSIRESFAKSISSFERERESYIKFFSENSLQEFLDDDVDAFRKQLKKKCPIIRRCVNSSRKEMNEWKIKFKDTSSESLLGVFTNLITFKNEYIGSLNYQEYADIDSHQDFGFKAIQVEEENIIWGVIGMGIKSSILYHLHPEIFPNRGRRDVYGLYFLSGCKDYGLPSKSSEFLMIDDEFKSEKKNTRMEYNYEYPYILFSLYAIRLYRLLKAKCKQLDIALDDHFRYVYVHIFLDYVCSLHSETIKTMLGGDEDDAPIG